MIKYHTNTTNHCRQPFKDDLSIYESIKHMVVLAGQSDSENMGTYLKFAVLQNKLLLFE